MEVVRSGQQQPCWKGRASRTCGDVRWRDRAMRRRRGKATRRVWA